MAERGRALLRPGRRIAMALELCHRACRAVGRTSRQRPGRAFPLTAAVGADHRCACGTVHEATA